MKNLKKVFYPVTGIMLCFIIAVMFRVDIYGKSEEYEYARVMGQTDSIILNKYLGSEKKVIIPETVDGYKVIGLSGTFAATDVEEVYIPSTMKNIGRLAFYRTKNLKNVVIPEGVEYIAEEAFAESGLKSIAIPKSLKTIYRRAFADSELTEIILPEHLETLDDQVFLNCTNLKSVVIPGSISTWEKGVFAGCTSLEKVVISEGITEIGYEAFSRCLYLSDVQLPESLQHIGASAFKDCYSLKEIAIPDNVTNVQTVFPQDTKLYVNSESSLYKELKNSGTDVEPKKDISTVKIQFSGDGYVYSGKKIQPLKMAGLTEGVDYTVTYKNNVNVGKATVTVKGIGKYKGQVNGLTFKIVPAKVSGIKQSGCTKTQIIIEWNACGGNVDGYEIEKSESNKQSWSLLGKVASSSIKINGLKSGEMYKYRVRAYKVVDGEKLYGYYSDSVVGKTAPDKVRNFRYSQSSSTKIQLKWNSQSGNSGYQIYKYSRNSGKYILLKTITGSSQYSWTNMYLKANTEYKYKIRSYVIINGKNYYGEFSDELKISTAPIRPKYRLVSNKKGQITVTWDKVDGATGYVLFYKEGKNGTWKALTNNKFTGNSFTKKNLKSGVKYYFYLRAVNNYNGTLIKSATYFKEKTVQ
ncbi:MAG: fibronectin type III domain-containing protein [Lachnospiraceae bacterium]|nr:fibronectin type III domain-containing protein [Lachnospiraceae bacterium]